MAYIVANIQKKSVKAHPPRLQTNAVRTALEGNMPAKARHYCRPPMSHSGHRTRRWLASLTANCIHVLHRRAGRTPCHHLPSMCLQPVVLKPQLYVGTRIDAGLGIQCLYVQQVGKSCSRDPSLDGHWHSLMGVLRTVTTRRSWSRSLK